MFVLNNAWSTLRRHPWRSILTALIAVLVSFTSLFTWSVRQANATATGSGYDALKPAATLRLTPAAQAKRNGADSGWTKNYLSWNDYTTYATAAQTASVNFSYTFIESVPVRQSSAFKAISGSADQSADKTGGEFTLFGLYSSDAPHDTSYGDYTIVSGKNLDYKTENAATKGAVLISKAVADRNHLTVGSEISVANPTNASKTISLTVRGIYVYTNKATTSTSKLAKDNPDNAIYASYYGFGSNGFDVADGKGWAIPDLNVVFKLSSMSSYNKFVKVVKAAKLPSKYEISSITLTDYRDSIAPLGRLNTVMTILAHTVWGVGGLALLVLVIMGLLKRRAEIATALVIGIPKARIGWQFMLEVLMPTVCGTALGIAAGALGSRALGSALTGGQATAASAGIIWHAIGWGVAACLVLAFVALMRVLLLQTSTIFTTREEVSR